MIERFAPSPTGLLHLGHAYSAALGWLSAKRRNGQFLLRIEDLDTSRCRAEFYDAIEEDLIWLGLRWDGKILRQTERLAAYEQAINTLTRLGVIYPCICTRKDLRNVMSAPQEGEFDDPIGLLYPGTCRDRELDPDKDVALRLNMNLAVNLLGGAKSVEALTFGAMDGSDTEIQQSISVSDLIHRIGDVVLKRKDGAYAYHLAVVVDDAFQGITHVTRGEDLLRVTAIHRVLQALLELPTPVYYHHPLIRDETGKRLAKRDDARSLRAYRQAGMTPSDAYAKLGLNDQVAEFAA